MAKVVGEPLAVAAVSEGLLAEVLLAEGLLAEPDCRDSGVGVAGKSEVAQPAARAKLSPMKLAAKILRKLSS